VPVPDLSNRSKARHSIRSPRRRGQGAIAESAALDLIPPLLIEQLKTGGKLVLPAGLPDSQTLILVEKPRNGGITTKEILPVRFLQLDSPESA